MNREITIINTATGRPFIDMDPKMIEVLDGGDNLANPFDNNLLDMFDAVMGVEDETPGGSLRLGFVWTATGARVRTLCPGCDDVVDVSTQEMSVEDLPDNHTGLVCFACFD